MQLNNSTSNNYPKVVQQTFITEYKEEKTKCRMNRSAGSWRVNYSEFSDDARRPRP